MPRNLDNFSAAFFAPAPDLRYMMRDTDLTEFSSTLKFDERNPTSSGFSSAILCKVCKTYGAADRLELRRSPTTRSNSSPYFQRLRRYYHHYYHFQTDSQRVSNPPFEELPFPTVLEEEEDDEGEDGLPGNRSNRCRPPPLKLRRAFSSPNNHEDFDRACSLLSRCKTSARLVPARRNDSLGS